MRKILITFFVLFTVAAIKAASHNIDNGSQWNNASMDYTAQVKANGTIVFTACAEGQGLAFVLTPNPTKNGEYRLSDIEPNDDGDINPFSDSSKAKHLRKDGLNLLCLYDNQDRLQDVLTPIEYIDGMELAELKWTSQLRGDYNSIYDEPLAFGDNGRMRFGAIDLIYHHVTFNGTITGVIEIIGGTRLEGIWEVEITRDGLKLNKGQINEWGWFEPNGEVEYFTWARKDIPRFDYASAILLNDGMYRRLDPSVLRLMRNEIWFHHGYVPVSEDLREYLADKEWYTPRESNDGILSELSTIEVLNIEMIKTTEILKEQIERENQDGFDFEKYRQQLLDYAEANLMWRKSEDDIKLISYALIDIDNDGIQEVWVRGDEGQDFQGVYTITPEGEVNLLESSDARSELIFYPSAVGSQGYYGEGEGRGFVQLVKDSKPAGYCSERVLLDFYSEDMEVVEEDYNVNGKPVSKAEYDAFYKSLGTPYVPEVQWHDVSQ